MSQTQLKTDIAALVEDIKATINNGDLTEASVLPKLQGLQNKLLDYIKLSYTGMQQAFQASKTADSTKYEQLKKLFESSIGLFSSLSGQIDTLIGRPSQ
jgi:hypothetical protein